MCWQAVEKVGLGGRRSGPKSGQTAQKAAKYPKGYNVYSRLTSGPLERPGRRIAAIGPLRYLEALRKQSKQIYLSTYLERLEAA